MTNQEAIALLKKNPIAVGCALLAIGLGVGVYLRSDGVPDASQKLDQVSREGQRLAENIRNKAQLSEQLDEMAAAQKAIEPRIIHESDLATNLQYFYKIEADTGVKITELHQNNSGPAKPGPKPTYIGVSFSVSVEGEYPAILDFLRRLEHGSHYCRALAANLIKGGSLIDRSGPLRLSLTVELLGQP